MLVMNGWMMDGWMDGWMLVMNGWMDGLMNERMKEWTDELMDAADE
jgi:hypothetical protein